MTTADVDCSPLMTPPRLGPSGPRPPVDGRASMRAQSPTFHTTIDRGVEQRPVHGRRRPTEHEARADVDDDRDREHEGRSGEAAPTSSGHGDLGDGHRRRRRAPGPRAVGRGGRARRRQRPAAGEPRRSAAARARRGMYRRARSNRPRSHRSFCVTESSSVAGISASTTASAAYATSVPSSSSSICSSMSSVRWLLQARPCSSSRRNAMPLPYSPLDAPSVVRPSGRRWWRSVSAAARNAGAGRRARVAHPVLALHRSGPGGHRLVDRPQEPGRDDRVGVDDHERVGAGHRPSRRSARRSPTPARDPCPGSHRHAGGPRRRGRAAISAVASVQWSAITWTDRRSAG